MPARPPRLADGHDSVGGAVVGVAGLDRPDPEAPDWRQLLFVEQVLRECAAVVSYVADAEERNGFPESARHYRRLGDQVGDALPIVRRVSVGPEGLPLALLDQVRMGVDRLALVLDVLSAGGR